MRTCLLYFRLNTRFQNLSFIKLPNIHVDNKPIPDEWTENSVKTIICRGPSLLPIINKFITYCETFSLQNIPTHCNVKHKSFNQATDDLNMTVRIVSIMRKFETVFTYLFVVASLTSLKHKRIVLTVKENYLAIQDP